jgi:hypothetical protein
LRRHGANPRDPHAQGPSGDCERTRTAVAAGPSDR